MCYYIFFFHLLMFVCFRSRIEAADMMWRCLESELILRSDQAAVDLADRVQNELVGWWRRGVGRGEGAGVPHYAADYPLLSTATVKLLSPLLWG